MDVSQRQRRTLHETARILRSPGCAPHVLRALRLASLTAPELCRVFRDRYRPRTIYGGLQTLRLLGLAAPGRKVRRLGSVAELWRAN